MEDVLFCASCGAFREPRSTDGKNFDCPLCKAKVPIEEVSRKIEGSSLDIPIERSEVLLRLSGRDESGKGEEAVIDEECPKCKFSRLSYHTAQLRGVDEGQTVFYTCLNDKCKHKFTVNS